MSFLVNFRSAEGKQGYHPADTVEDAVRFVEHLRNQEHVTDARVWRLHEVPLEVKTYYKVEVVSPAAEASPSAAAPAPAPAAAVEAQPRPERPPGVSTADALSAPGANGSNGARFSRFNRN